MNPITLSRMLPLEGTVFRIQTNTALQAELVLEKVEDKGASKGHEQFSLLFRSDPEVRLLQGTYELTHSSEEPIVLFIVPVAKREDGFRYEAVFNLLKR